MQDHGDGTKLEAPVSRNAPRGQPAARVPPWGKLTDDDWEVVAGDKDKFIGKLRERYGWSREEAERSAKEYFDNLS